MMEFIEYYCGGKLTPFDLSTLSLIAACSLTDCGTKNTIKPKDAIRCRECGYRILYKMRTKRMIQLEAR